MSSAKYKLKSPALFMLLSNIELAWSTYCIESISDETRASYHKFIENLEKDVALPHSDILEFEISVICTDKN